MDQFIAKPADKLQGLLACFDRVLCRGSLPSRKRRLDVEIPAAELRRRLVKWKPSRPRYTTGVFAKYAQLAANASQGAVTS